MTRFPKTYLPGCEPPRPAVRSAGSCQFCNQQFQLEAGLMPQHNQRAPISRARCPGGGLPPKPFPERVEIVRRCGACGTEFSNLDNDEHPRCTRCGEVTDLMVVGAVRGVPRRPSLFEKPRHIGYAEKPTTTFTLNLRGSEAREPWMCLARQARILAINLESKRPREMVTVQHELPFLIKHGDQIQLTPVGDLTLLTVTGKRFYLAYSTAMAMITIENLIP